MNILIALCCFVLSLFRCDGGAIPFVHRAGADDGDTLYSVAYVQVGGVRIECVRGASGQCHYTLYPRGCAPAAHDGVRGPPNGRRAAIPRPFRCLAPEVGLEPTTP